MQRDGKRIIFSPASSSNRFVIFGTSDVRLNEYRPELHPARAAIKTLAVLTDLPALRTLAWSPHAATDDLVAIGLATGRTLVTRLSDVATNQAPASVSALPYHAVSLNVRQQRPVNSIAFSSSEPNLLAVALEKARDHAVHVWDLERSIRVLETRIEGSQSDATVDVRSSPSRTRTSTSPAPEPRPFTLLGSGEAANSVAFVQIGSATSSQLVVGMGGKSIRCYDVRERPLAASQQYPAAPTSTNQPERNTRAVYGLAADPFDGFRFLSHDDAGVIKLWDARFAADAVLTFSGGDTALSMVDPSRSASTTLRRSTPGVLGVHFSPSRRGVLASMEVNTLVIHLWDIWQGAERWAEPASHADSHQTFVPPILGSSRHTRSFSRSPSSFAFVNSTTSSNSQTFCSVSREGHIEFIQHFDQVQSAWTADGEFAALNGKQLRLWNSSEATKTAIVAVNRGRAAPSSLPQSVRPSFSRLSTLSQIAGERTPRPQLRKRHTSLQDDDIRSVMDRLTQLRTAEEEEDAPNAVASDISTVMRARVHIGYSTEAGRNSKLTSDALSDFWSWFSHAQQVILNGRAVVDRHDFAFAGTLPILRGILSIQTKRDPQPERSMRGQTSVSFGISRDAPSDSAQAHDEVARALRRTANMSPPMTSARGEYEYNQAVQQFIELNNVVAYVKVTTKKMGRRKLALFMLGPEFASDDMLAIARRAGELGYAERAAAWAIFCGNTEEALHTLRGSKDERLKLLAPTLAAHTSITQMNATFGELFSALSADLHDPFLRAIFAYLGDRSWLDVLDEQSLPLRDRLAISLRYLSDEELMRYLDSLTKSLILDADLEGIAVTGLTGQGFQLLQNYCDRTGDVQTAALAASYVHPGRLYEPRAERWIQSYRMLLDAWHLYVPRARFDVARGDRMRSSQLALAGAGATVEPYDLAPSRLLIRCNYCNKTVAPSTINGGSLVTRKVQLGGTYPASMDGGRTGPASRLDGPRGMRTRPTTCPWCHKKFPRCSICLASISVPDPAEDAEPPMAWCWCQRCRHGGHAVHLSEWFRGHRACAVADCACECMQG